jgi:hypothetical protein
MDPLNGVSTDGGRNMRETCLRVLAAGLMTAAIAAVVGMSTLVATPSVPVRPIAVPPSALNAVRIHVALVSPRRRVVKRVRATPRINTPPPQTVIKRRVVSIHTRPPSRRLASNPVTPAAPAPTPVVEAAQPEAPVTTQPAESDEPKNNGHAYGHDKQHGKGSEKHEE